jgi:hypothetical protein
MMHVHGTKFSMTGLRRLLGNLEPLGALRMTAAAVSSGVLAIPPRSLLVIAYDIAGYSAADIASWRFNADAGSNYQTRYITAAIASTTLTNAATLTTTLMRLAGTSIVAARSGICVITNVAGRIKIMSNHVMDTTAAVGTEPALNITGGGSWFNTTAQINSIEMRTAGGANTLTAGTGFAVFGKNF